MATKTAIKMKQLENLTASRALVTGTDQKIEASATTSAEVGYLASANSTLQDGKVLVPDSGAVNMNSITQTNVDIDSGAIDNTPIGANTPSSGAFTTLQASGNVDLGDNAADTITLTGRFDSDLLPIDDNARDLGSGSLRYAEGHIASLHADQLGQALDANSQAITNVDINSGNIDDTAIGATGPSTGAFTTLSATGNVVLGDASSDTIRPNGRFSSDVVPAADSSHALGSSALQWSEIHVDQGHIDQLGSALDANSQAITNINVDSGNIDGTAIGAASPSTGVFSSVGLDNVVFSSVTTSNEVIGNSDTALITEAAVKKHIEAHSEGLDVKESVVAASTGGMSGFAYQRQKDGSAYNVANGTADKDVGHINKKDVGWLVLDNYLITKVGERVLIKDGVDTSGQPGFEGEGNGIYESTIVGGLAGNSKLEFVALNDTISEARDQRIEFRLKEDGNNPASNTIDAAIIFRDSASASGTSFVSGGGGAPYELELTVSGTGALASRDALMNQIRTAFGNSPFSNYTVSALSTGNSDQNRTAHSDSGNASFSVTAQNSGAGMDMEIVSRDLSEDYLQFAAFPYVAASARPVIKRASDADGVDADGVKYSPGEKTDFNPGLFCFVEQGKQFADCGFVYVGDEVVEFQNEFLGMKFSQFSSKGVITAGYGLKKVGNDISENFQADFDVMPAADVTATDTIVMCDVSDAGKAHTLTFARLAEVLVDAGEGMRFDSEVISMDISQLSADGSGVLAHGDEFAFDDSGTTKRATTQAVAALFSGGSEFTTPTNSQLELAAGGVALSKLASVNAAQILVGPNGNGSPAAVDMTGDITISDAGVTAIGADKVLGTMLHTSAADTVTMELSSDSLSVLKVPNDLTVGSGLEFASGNEYHGGAARQIRLKAGGIAQDAISHLVGFCKVTTAIAALSNGQNVIETSDLTINSNSQLDQLHKLAHPDYAAQNGTDQRTAVNNLNAAMTARVYLNGMLLFPEVGGDDTTTFANVSGSDIADYKFVANDPGGAAEDVRIVFNGALLEDGDLIQIEAISRV